MTRREMPLVLMLIAGAVTAIFTYFRGYGLSSMLIALLATLVAFYFIGCVIKMILDSFEKEKKEREKAESEGEVIEKEAEPESETQEDNK